MAENEQQDVEQTLLQQDDNANMTTQSQNTTANGGKTYPKIVPILCIAAFFMLFGVLIAATALLITGHKIGAIVCAAIFATVLLSVVFGTIIRTEWSLRNDIRKAKNITEGKVTRCVMSNMTEYSVEVNANGKVYTVSSKDSYETDDEVMIAIFSKKRARIVNEKELELLNEPLYGKAPSSHRHHYHHHHHHH